MKKLFIILAVTMTVMSCHRKPEYGFVDESKYKLVWADEFDYQTRDQLLQNWKSADGPTTHTLCSRWPENVEVGDGTVRLVNHKESRGGQEWTSGSIWTKQVFKYGFYECRYKYAGASGTNNAFWLVTLGDSPEPAEGKRFEIDINEGHYPNEINTTIHNLTDKPMKSVYDVFAYDDIDFSKEFHIFGLEWTPEEFVFFLDGKEIWRAKNEIAYSPATLLLSLAILPGAGEVTDAIDGTYMEVDYVRVYEAK